MGGPPGAGSILPTSTNMFQPIRTGVQRVPARLPVMSAPRAVHTARPRAPLRVSPRVRAAPKSLARPLCASMMLSTSLFFFSNQSPVPSLSSSQSGSILREASPAAMSKQAYTLVFVSSDSLRVSRSQWQAWIYYFREAGYDCIDLKIEPPKDTPEDMSPEDVLARELTGQVRDSSLQRQPVIFIRDGGDQIVKDYLGKGGLFSRRGPMSGLVLLHPQSDKKLAETDWPSNTPILVVPASPNASAQWEDTVKGAKSAKVMGDEWSEKEGLLKEVERWLRNSGL